MHFGRKSRLQHGRLRAVGFFSFFTCRSVTYEFMCVYGLTLITHTHRQTDRRALAYTQGHKSICCVMLRHVASPCASCNVFYCKVPMYE